MSTHYNAFAGGDVGRIEALSDGIFAFAATVLVLDFRTPDAADIHSEAELLSALLASSHRLMPWLLSLLTLGIFWVAQQTQLSQLARSNRDLTWLHLVFLAIITVLPFTTRLLADFFTYRTAFLIYWANIFLLGVAVYVTWAYSERAKLHSGRRASSVVGRVSEAGHHRPVALRAGRAHRPRQRAARACAHHPDPAQLRHRAEAAHSLAPVEPVALARNRSAPCRERRKRFPSRRKEIQRKEEDPNEKEAKSKNFPSADRHFSMVRLRVQARRGGERRHNFLFISP